MQSIKNQTTQPIQEFTVFNNWNEIANGWYFVIPSKDLPKKSVRAIQICGHELVFYRGDDDKVRALDAYCPHMGTHLGKGKVIENKIQCFFHHWQFNEDGHCVHIPCQEEIPAKAKVQKYSVAELYESIWIYPSSGPEHTLVDFPDLAHTTEKLISFGKTYERTCHHHVTMINGIDPQHLKTVHQLDIEMNVDISEPQNGNMIDITLKGKIGIGNWREKVARYLIGSEYSYSMRYDHGNNGFLTLMRDVYFFNHKWPMLHMIFAYRPIEKGRLMVQPIYVTKKRSGVFGKMISYFLIWLTKKAFFALQGEDGAVYENMRFYPANLLGIDRPVGQYIQYVNKLKISPWKLP
jgi:phenylpropionate dioxygenase-like ring-hydroxylating dioxygenase large terminal subunit